MSLSAPSTTTVTGSSPPSASSASSCGNCLLRRIAKNVYHVTLEDPFTQRARKYGVFVLTIMLPIFLADGLGAFRFAATDDDVVPHRVQLTRSMTSIAFTIVVLWSTYEIYKSKRATNNTMEFLCISTVLLILFITLVDPLCQLQSLYFCLLVFGSLVRIEQPILQHLYFTGLFVQGYNHITNAIDSRYLLSIFSDDRQRDLVIADQIVIVVVFCLTMALLKLQNQQFDRAVERSEKSSKFATDIAKALLRYDTTGAREIVQQYQTDDNHNPILCKKLCSIVSNMEAYRPFLPNYLLCEGEDEDSLVMAHLRAAFQQQEDSEQNGGGNTDDAVVPLAPPALGRSTSSGNHLFVFESLTSADPSSIDTTADSAKASSSVVPRSMPVGAWRATLGLVDYSWLASLSMKSTTTTAAAVAAGITNTHDSALRTAGSAGSCTVNTPALWTAVTTMSAFVDRLHEIAESTSATIHGFFGDAVHLSWNTARRVGGHETKAIQFLDKCKCETRCVGAARSGDTRFQMCGGRKQIVAIVSAAWFADVAAMFRLHCCRLGINVVDEELVEACEHSVQSQMIDAMTSTVEVRVIRVYHLISLNAAADHASMMLLDHRESVFETVISKCIEGRFQEALSMLTHRLHLPWISESALIVIFGLILGGIVYAIDSAEGSEDRFMAAITFDVEQFVDFILPIIIFEAGFSLPHSGVVRNIGTISLFAIIGTLISTIVLTFCLQTTAYFLLPDLYETKGSFFLMATWGALMSATDPVAVIAVLGSKYDLKNSAEPPLLYNLIFGESVLNDAVAIVLFNTCIQYISDDVTAANVFEALGIFIYAFLVAIVFGYIFGLLCAKFLKHFDLRHHPEIEIFALIVFAALSYFSAEAAKTSGIMALFVCARVIGSRAMMNVSEQTTNVAGFFFKTLATIAETYVFLFLGLGVWAYEHNAHWGFVFTALILVLISRAFVVFPLSAITNFRRHVERITLNMQLFMWFAGLRGAIAFGLCLIMLEKAHKHEDGIHLSDARTLLSTALFIILFMVIIMGSLSGIVLSALGLDKATSHIQGMDELEAQLLSTTDSAVRRRIRHEMDDKLHLDEVAGTERSWLKRLLRKMKDFELTRIAPFVVREEVQVGSPMERRRAATILRGGFITKPVDMNGGVVVQLPDMSMSEMVSSFEGSGSAASPIMNHSNTSIIKNQSHNTTANNDNKSKVEGELSKGLLFD